MHDARAHVRLVPAKGTRDVRRDRVPDARAPARGKVRRERDLWREAQEGAVEGETCGFGG